MGLAVKLPLEPPACIETLSTCHITFSRIFLGVCVSLNTLQHFYIFHFVATVYATMYFCTV